MNAIGERNLQWANLLVEELVRCGVRLVCLASGSRSSPLAVAAARQVGWRNVVHMDERGAAFCALGAARASGAPAAWITTSGSAVANGFPAVVEASSGRVPLILVTADRPPELRATGANQTIDQVRIFGDHVRWQFDLPCPTEEIAPEFLLSTVDQAVYRACTVPAGPVHLNCMFREPLLPASPEHRAPPLSPAVASWQAGRAPYTTYASAAGFIPDVTAAAQALRPCRRGVIVAGELRTPAERDAVAALATGLQWPLLPDIASGLRLGPCTAPRAAFVDQMLLAEPLAQALLPDAILHVGGAAVGKRLAQFLAAATSAVQVQVRRDPARLDPAHRLRHRIDADVVAGCDALCQALGRIGDADWTARWRVASDEVERELQQALAEGAAATEPNVARAISQLIPDGHVLFVGNSMPIRDLDMYAVANGPVPRLILNRGASGIDGGVATTVGAAIGAGSPATALLGDLALLHDLNSLAMVARAGAPVTFVVINNNGGGIFSFLPMSRWGAVFESHFGTPHGLTFQSAAAMFSLGYARADTRAGFESAYRAATQGTHSSIIEVTTDRAANVRVHEALQQRVRARLTR